MTEASAPKPRLSRLKMGLLGFALAGAAAAVLLLPKSDMPALNGDEAVEVSRQVNTSLAKERDCPRMKVTSIVFTEVEKTTEGKYAWTGAAYACDATVPFRALCTDKTGNCAVTLSAK